MSHKRIVVVSLGLGLIVTSVLVGTASTSRCQAPPPVAGPAKGLSEWQTGDSGVAKMSLVGGDSPTELKAFRIHYPAGFEVDRGAHFHVWTEHVVVLKGTIVLGFGEKTDPANVTEYGPGSFISIPPGRRTTSGFAARSRPTSRRSARTRRYGSRTTKASERAARTIIDMTAAPVLNTSVVLCQMYSGSSSRMCISTLTPDSATGNPGSTGLKGLTVGSEQAQTANYGHTGKIAEALWFNTVHSSSTRAIRHHDRSLTGTYGI